ncbi:hypothetical protein MHL31_09405 [Lutibacter sp. A80]|uniref:hypothetical protein n=1 Tax=Lutibacter sp. A80 TaxID=2918453 RepID=UPI001F062631|nr:hypothetical protein [Lutibacter sp. A80]UMB59295.1 hypothetical protein MHL31_09405 [Lutibacter sp. A80]
MRANLKNSITYLFLVLFISIKMTGIHALLHNDDDEHALHCVICENAITHNLTPAITPDSEDFTIENIEFVTPKNLIKHYSFISLTTIESNQLFSRPPPSLL